MSFVSLGMACINNGTELRRLVVNGFDDYVCSSIINTRIATIGNSLKNQNSPIFHNVKQTKHAHRRLRILSTLGEATYTKERGLNLLRVANNLMTSEGSRFPICRGRLIDMVVRLSPMAGIDMVMMSAADSSACPRRLACVPVP